MRTGSVTARSLSLEDVADIAQTARRRRAYVGFSINWAVAAGCAASTTAVRETGCCRAATFTCRATERAFWTIGVMSLWYCARSSTVFSLKPRALMFAASAGTASIWALTATASAAASHGSLRFTADGDPAGSVGGGALPGLGPTAERATGPGDPAGVP